MQDHSTPPAATPPIRCLLVDDDQAIRQLLIEYLRSFGMVVDSVVSGAELRQRLPRGGADVVLLDLMLPGEGGLSLCPWIKQTAPGLPIIMLIAQGDAHSRVLGLELGADDYLPKPFEPRELVARIKAVLRRAGAPDPDTRRLEMRFNGWVFHRELRQLCTPDGVLVALSAAEYRLLSALVDHPGQALSRERLLELSRAPGVEASERSIDLAVSRLRAKLGDSEGHFIRTLRGAGYVFTAKTSM
jgi:two-component system, OmpR family, response regulator